MTAKAIDLFEFCRHQQQLSGQVAIGELTRLSAELADQQGELRWSLQGGWHETGAAQLTLQIAGQVNLICQRCLTSYALAIASASLLVLAKTEAEADETEARLDDDSIDVIVPSSAQDVMVLVEDEALLALPLSPRHETCPDNASPRVSNEKAESPFAVLKKLK